VFGKASFAVNWLTWSRLEGYSGSLIARRTFYLINIPLRHYFTSVSYRKKNLTLELGNFVYGLSFSPFFLLSAKLFFDAFFLYTQFSRTEDLHLRQFLTKPALNIHIFIYLNIF
jgi:hypothetical protein